VDLGKNDLTGDNIVDNLLKDIKRGNRVKRKTMFKAAGDLLESGF
jgi:hypothetical protein